MKTEPTSGHLVFDGNELAFVGDPNVNVKYNISGGIVRDNTVTFELGSHNFTSEVNDSGAIGGSAINAAVAANRAAGPVVNVSLVSFFGKDRFTPLFEDLLEKEGIVAVYGHQNHKVPNDKTNEMIVPGGKPFFQDKIYIRDKIPRYDEMAKVTDALCLMSVNWPWIPTYRTTIEYAQEKGIALVLCPGPSQLNDLELTEKTLDEMKELHGEYRGVEISEIKAAFFATLKAAQILFVTKRDAIRICYEAAKNLRGETSTQDTTDVAALLRELSKFGPQIVSITDGDNGNYTLDMDGSVYRIDASVYPAAAPVDATGFDDIYAGTFMPSYLKGESVQDAMRKAAINATEVSRSPKLHEAMLTGSEIETIIAKYPTYNAHRV